MSRATALSTTSRHRKQTAKRPKPAAHPFIDPAALPDKYAMRVIGDCMAPRLSDGEQAVFSKIEKPEPGDLVALFYHPDCVPAEHLPIQIKQLVLAPPFYVTFPWKENPKSDVHALVCVAMTTPPRQFYVECSKLLAIHKFIGTQGQ